MSSYKSVRLEEHVYRELQLRMLPRESLSQTLERLLNNLDKVEAYACAIGKVVKGGE